AEGDGQDRKVVQQRRADAFLCGRVPELRLPAQREGVTAPREDTRSVRAKGHRSDPVAMRKGNAGRLSRLHLPQPGARLAPRQYCSAIRAKGYGRDPTLVRQRWAG